MNGTSSRRVAATSVTGRCVVWLKSSAATRASSGIRVSRWAADSTTTRSRPSTYRPLGSTRSVAMRAHLALDEAADGAVVGVGDGDRSVGEHGDAERMLQERIGGRAVAEAEVEEAGADGGVDRTVPT